MPTLRILLIVTIGSLLGGCSLKEPGVVLRQAAVTSETANGVVVAFELDATNANNVELPLREIRYSVMLDGRRVFEGIRSPEATLAPLGSHEMRLPASIAAVDLPEVAGPREIELRGTLLYVTPGRLADLLFDNGVRVPKKAFGARVTLDLPGAPAVSGG